jgi:hypothetical protein
MNLGVKTWNLKEPVEDVKGTKSREEYLDPRGRRKRRRKKAEDEDNWTMNNFKRLLST